jgi:hypothetical protein
LFSEKNGPIINSIKYLRKLFVKQNMSLLNATKEKMIDICERLEFPCSNLDTKEFLKILTEKAAIVSL